MPLPRFLCRLIGHRHSRRGAYVDTERRWRSYCRRCGVQLRKEWPDGWQELSG